MIEKLLHNLVKYNEELERIDLERKELFTKNRELKRTMKTVDSLREQGIEVSVPLEIMDSVKELEALDLDKKILKSIIRRYESVIELYQSHYKFTSSEI